MTYKLSDYGTNPLHGVNPNLAKERGWGSGWPNCQTSKIVTIVRDDVRVPIRSEIASLVLTLFRATEEAGYDLRGGSVLGYSCRPIAGTTRPSNHSWGLAVDIHPTQNPASSTFKCDIPPNIVKMWMSCGFYWGGYYSRYFDTMHFEYVFKPGDVAGHLAKARLYIKPKVSLSKVIEQAIATVRTATEDVLVVQKALSLEVGLDYSSGPGLFGPKTKEAYSKWQKSLGYTGPAADGVPGRISLTKLGDKRGFAVVD